MPAPRQNLIQTQLILQVFALTTVNFCILCKTVIFICVWALSLQACLCTMYMYVWYLKRPGVRSPGIGITMWVLGIKVGPLEEQPVRLTPEPSLQPSTSVLDKENLEETSSSPESVRASGPEPLLSPMERVLRVFPLHPCACSCPPPPELKDTQSAVGGSPTRQAASLLPLASRGGCVFASLVTG